MLNKGVPDSFRSASTCHRRDRGVLWSVGPGLLLALVLLASAARAETPVGLDAQGVDPRVAVDNRWGLDVRDEQGRPVTREKVLSDLKGTAVARAAKNAFASSLPKARAVLSTLELLAEAAASVRMAMASSALPELLSGLPGGRPKLTILLMLMLACTATTITFCCRQDVRLTTVRSRQSSIEILRC